MTPFAPVGIPTQGFFAQKENDATPAPSNEIVYDDAVTIVYDDSQEVVYAQ